MTDEHRQFHLNLFLSGAGHHEGAWRYSGADPERLNDLGYYIELARIAERAKFDSLFLADIPYLSDGVRYGGYLPLEPLTFLSALAAATERIGLIGTASTTYMEPYNLARQFASLDHLSGGRSGWNIVTTSIPAASKNFGLDAHPSHADRYARSEEFVEVVSKLWDSWEDGAMVADRASGVFVDIDRVHEIAHEGPNFRVRGPLNISRPPQGRPVLVQAGSSEAGKTFAARHAEAIFTAQHTLEEAQEFYADVKDRAASLGRDRNGVVVLPGVIPIIGDTEANALALQDELLELTRPEAGLEMLKMQLGGIDLSDHPLDEPFPDLGEAKDALGGQQRFAIIVEHARREGLTLRQVLRRLAGGHGHRVLIGAPEQVADDLEQWFHECGADGFSVMPPYFPGGLQTFVDEIVPLLQRRGIYRNDYTGATLRDHYGLGRPASRFAALAAA